MASYGSLMHVVVVTWLLRLLLFASSWGTCVMRSEGAGHCQHHGHSARTLTQNDIKSSKVTQKLHAGARIVAKDLLGTMDSLSLAGAIAQACPGVFVGSKWLI